jgi:glycosyltransferase involved in cell wall biosynthesis
MRVLMITSVWPTEAHPERAPFVVRQVEFLRRRGVEVDVLHVDGRRDPRAYARRWREVRAKTSASGYDLIHAQWGQAALVALPARLPLVVTFRGSDLEGLATPDGRYGLSGHLLRGLSKFAARSADEIIVVSERLARYFPRRSCHVIPSGVDLDLFQPMARTDARRQLGLAPDRRYILFAADPRRLVKRHALAEQTMAAVQRRFAAELLVAGSAPPSMMPLFMNACDALLLTSLHEGSPNVVKEALACNLPVVTVDVGDVRERLAGIDGCAVSDSDTPESLASAVCDALTRGQRVAGRAAVQHLNEAALTERVIGVYDLAVAARR